MLLLLALGCPKPTPVPVDTDTDTDTTVPPGPTGDTDVPTPQPAPFGLETRPANPSCVAPPEGPLSTTGATLERVWPSVSTTNPVGLTMAPGDPLRWYLIEQSGRVKRFSTADATPTATTVLQLTDIDSGGERGLLGIAFDPAFQTSGLVYLHYNAVEGGQLVSRLSRFTTTNNGADWDLGSEQVLMTVNQPFGNHNGGHIEFGPDGMLYWGLGDGGSGGDPLNNAQNLNTVLGAMLRLDVSGATAVAPADNPFVGVPNTRPEIYAYGLRNPWRWSFDPVSGDLWLGDVGQDLWEEFDLIEAGGNYGWRIREGAHCFDPDPCDPAGLIDPIVDYPQDPGRSIVGGVVYRGTEMPSLVGTPLFADFYDGNVYQVVYDAQGQPRMEVLASSNLSITHFAYDATREVIVLDRAGGAMYRLVPSNPVGTDPFPQTLSATGCFAGDGTPAEGMIPYTINHPFWSDHATKQRWVAIPDGTTIGVTDGELQFPVGTVLAKHFRSNGVPTETRLFMQHTQDQWRGYTYRWREDGTDADLLAGSSTVDIGGGDTWHIPDRSTCAQCHTNAAGYALGLELEQLDRDQTYPSTGLTAPQLDTLDHIGLFTDPLPAITPFVRHDDQAAPIEQRARTWLHVNCSSCHQPNSTGRAELDLRFDTPLDQTGLCGEPTLGDLGLTDARILAPGAPDRSVLVRRIEDRGAYGMPPVGSMIVDPDGTALIRTWLDALQCP